MEGNAIAQTLKRFILFILFLSVVFAAANISFAADNVTSNETKYTHENNTNNGSNGNYTLPDPINTRTGTHYTSIQSAINDAARGDTITAEAGTYYENLIIDRNINLIGAGEDVTIINGQQKGPVITIIPGVTVTITGFTITNGKSAAGGGILNNGGNLTLRNSSINGNHVFSDLTTAFGAGIYNNGILTLQNSIIAGNSMLSLDNRGSGIYNDRGSVRLQNSQIIGNTADGGMGYGGGIYNFYGSVILLNSQISGNRLHSASIYSSGGAGILNEGNVTLINSAITGNIASADYSSNSFGGGIYNGGNVYTDYISSVNGNTPNDVYLNSITIVPCTNLRTGKFYFTIQEAITDALDGDTISVSPGTYYENLVVNRNINIIGSGKDKTIIDGQQKGPVITINSGTITISGFTVQHGKTDFGGGINNEGTLTLKNSTIRWNNATGFGGGICSDGTLTLQNSEVTGNTAEERGGGIFNTGTLTLQNSQITGNTGNTDGGGIYNDYGSVTLLNSIITGNTASWNGGGIYNYGDVYADKINCIYRNSPDNVYGNAVQSTTSTKPTNLYIQIKNSTNNIIVGKTFTLTYKLGNKGPYPAVNVTVTIPLPEGFVVTSISGDGKWTYNANTRTITWTLANVPVGDPYLYVSGKVTKPGNYVFSSSISSNTYNISTNNTPTTINAVSEVKAVHKTIGMQETGLPFADLIFAVLMVLSGLTSSRRR